jgi:hypothetical protein
MLDKLTRGDFGPLLGSSFRLEADGASLELKLIAADAAGASRSGTPRQPFSLLFHGPHAPLLAQQIYPLEHTALGLLEIFLVPIGPDDQGQRYQAIFA